jgi:hypothetical protein
VYRADPGNHSVGCGGRSDGEESAGLSAIYLAFRPCWRVDGGAILLATVRLKRHLATVARAMGVLMVLTGIGFLTRSMSTFSIWLMETFPALANFG